jgi:hypothetical protein
MNGLGSESNRLDAFLRLARERNWCHRWACTTCGSREFFGGLQELVDELGGGLAGKAEMAKSIAMMPLIPHSAMIEDVLVWLSQRLPADDLDRILGRTDAGMLFAAMKSAKAAAEARRHDHEFRNDPAFVEAERARKKEERAAAHQKRLAAKALRDAARKGVT